MNIVFLAFIGLSWVAIECLIGGTRLVFSLPAYGLLAIAAILSLAGIRGAKRTPPDAFCLGSTLLLGTWILLRAWHSPVPYLAWPDFSMMLACLMTWLLTAFYLTGTGAQTALITLLWGISALELWVGMIQFIHDPAYMFFGFLRPTLQRPSGMYISPNNFAGLLAAVAAISMSLGVWSRWKIWAKILAFYVAAFCMAGVAISGSRGGYFDVIGSMLCFVFASSYIIRAVNPRRFALVATLSLCALASGVALAAFLMSHSQFLTHRMQTMVVKDVRIYNWEAAIDHIRVSPWVGTGAGTHLIYGRLFRRPFIQADPVHAHCDYLELVAEYGFVGALCMALFLTAHFRNALRTYSEILRHRFIPSGFHLSNRFAIQLGALCAVVGLAIHSVVDFDMHIPGNALIFAFLFGVLANPDLDRPLSVVDRRVTPLAKFLAPALGVFVLWWAVPLIPSEYFAEAARRSLRDYNFLAAIDYAKKGINGAPAPEPVAPEDAADQPPYQYDLDLLLSKGKGDPLNPDLYFYLGEANRVLATRIHNPYINQSYFQQAADAFDSGLRIFPQNESMLVRDGQALDAMHKFDDAEAVYQKALQCDPNLALIHTYYISHLTAAGKKSEAAAAADWENHRAPAVDTDSKADFPLQ